MFATFRTVSHHRTVIGTPSNRSTALPGISLPSSSRCHKPMANAPSISSNRMLQRPLAGSRHGNGGRRRTGAVSTPTHPRRSLEKATPANGSRATRATISRAGRIASTGSKGSWRVSSRRMVVGLAADRTTNVPAAPTLTTSSRLRAAATFAGRKTCDPPTFAARRKTTCAMRRIVAENGPRVGPSSPLRWIVGGPG